MTSLEKELIQNNSQNLNEQLIQLKSGETKVLEDIYISTKSSVYSYVLTILKNKEDAEDVLHDTYVSIYKSSDTYKPKGNPMGWILTIARNHAFMKFRKDKNTIALSSEHWENLEYVDNDLSTEDKFVFNDLLNCLSDEERQIVILHAISGLKHREISKLQQKPLSTVLSKYNRAMKKMKNIYKEREVNE